MLTKDLTEPFTLRDLPDLGLSLRRLRMMIADGEVVRVVSGAFAPADLGTGLEVRAAAVGRVLRKGHVACDRTAAWLHGIDLYTYGEHDSGLVVEMCAGPGVKATTRAGVDGHRRSLVADEVMTVHGVPTTTPLRTAVDLACILERRDAMAALDAFRRHHGVAEEDLTRLVQERFAGRRGVVQARSLIPLSDPRAESIRESWVRISMLDAGLPAPEPQFWVVVDGVPTWRIDLAYPRKRIAVEYDGFEPHEATEELIRETEERRAWLRAHGWTVIVVRNGDFTGKRLDRWIGELEAALRPSYTNRRRLERSKREF